MTGRVLIVDDVATNRAILKAKLTAAYYAAETAASGPEALDMAAQSPPDLVLLDVMMPVMDGFEVCRRLKAEAALAHIPVVMITALDEMEDRVRGLEAGADDFLSKPVDDLALFARLRSLIRVKLMVDELRLRDETSEALGVGGCAMTTAIGGGSVLVVERDAQAASDVQAHLRARLSAEGLRIDCASAPFPSRPQPVGEPAATAPDVVLAACDADAFDGLRYCSQLRANPITRNASIIALAAPKDLQTAAQALDLGAVDYMLRPLDWCELAVRVRSQLRRKIYADQLRDGMRDTMRLAAIDGLTGVFNRRYAMSHLKAMIRRARDTGTPLSAMMLDIDWFGHPAGDAVLKEFASRVSASIRSVDMVARLGGEEFIVALPDAELTDAGVVAERVRAAVEAPAFHDTSLPAPLSITVSIGVARAGPEDDADRLIARADAALYAAKNSGRNRITFAAAA